jgi:hypothetical protein
MMVATARNTASERFRLEEIILMSPVIKKIDHPLPNQGSLSLSIPLTVG